jgi:uncharacterized protein (TIGR02246 family)
MRSPAAILAIVALMVAPAAAGAQTWVTVNVTALAPAPPSDLAAVRSEYASALNAGDAGRLGALYSADAIAVPADGIVLRGRDEINRYFSETCEARPAGTNVTLTPQQFSTGERLASETGLFSESSEGDPSSVATGVYVTIYERGANGDWRIALEIRTRGRDKQIVRW